ncbi:MAG TPA: glycosyltransferase family 4 protein [Bacteroidia bacterium]|jgi:glycosyltransferase involved in cell wall biosynthesis|nr:glycosyltransferase family 4 protein [Bacteroidia bacterium]
MKILQVNTEKTWRGGERQTYYNIQGFLQQGHEVELLCRKDFPLHHKAKGLDINIHTVNNGLQAVMYLMKHARYTDIVHAQTASAQMYGVMSRLFHKTPVVYTRRVDFVPSGFFTQLKYNRTDKLVSISSAIKNILEDFGQSNISVIPDIANPKKLNTDRASKLIHFRGWHNKKIIGTVAALVPHKDPITMVKAIHELSQMRDDFMFLHFGEGELQEETEKEIAHLNVSRWYHLMGHVDDVEDFFSIFDVYTMSSQEEGLGSSVLDAFQYKIPVVSTNAGGLHEMVEGNGLLCDVKDYKALALSINEILNDTELAKAITENAFETVAAKYSLQAITNEYLKIFESLLAGK